MQLSKMDEMGAEGDPDYETKSKYSISNSLLIMYTILDKHHTTELVMYRNRLIIILIMLYLFYS